MQAQQLTEELLDTVVSELGFERFKQILDEQMVEASFSPVECFYAAAVYFGATLNDCIYGELVDTDQYQFEYYNETIFCSTDSQAYDYAGDVMTEQDETEYLEAMYGDYARENIEQVRKDIGNAADYIDEEKYMHEMHYNNTGTYDLGDAWIEYKFGEVVETVQIGRSYYEVRKL